MQLTMRTKSIFLETVRHFIEVGKEAEEECCWLQADPGLQRLLANAAICNVQRYQGIDRAHRTMMC